MAATIRRDSAGASAESYSRWRNRRNAMGNVMEGVRPSQLRSLESSLNHVVEHDTSERTTVPVPAAIVPEVPVTSTNVETAENDYGLAAILGFSVDDTTPPSKSAEDLTELEDRETADTSNGEDSGEERERILRSPVHKRRRNALADALSVVDEESLHRIRRLHANTSYHCHERL